MHSYPGLDDQYRAFISEQRCIVCGRWPSDPAHTGTRREYRVGMGQKTPDKTCIPLCRACHDEQHRIGQEHFNKKHHLDVPTIIAKLLKQYETGTRPL